MPYSYPENLVSDSYLVRRMLKEGSLTSKFMMISLMWSSLNLTDIFIKTSTKFIVKLIDDHMRHNLIRSKSESLKDMSGIETTLKIIHSRERRILKSLEQRRVVIKRCIKARSLISPH